MKTLTLTSILAAGALNLLSAQSGPLTVNIYTTDSSAVNGPATSMMQLSFSNGGKDSMDAYDSELANVFLMHDYCAPFTTSAENQFLAPVDNRDFFSAPKVLPFGMFSNHTANVSFTSESLGSVPDYNSSAWNEDIGNIYLEDMSTGIMHDIFGDSVALTVPTDTVPVARFQLHLYPALRVTTTDESCNSYADGAMHIVNPGSTNWILLVTGPTGTFSTPVAQTDTLLDMLPPGTYTLAAFTDGLLSDHKSVTIASHAVIVPSFTPSATVAGEGMNINFSNTSAGNYSWVWNMGDGNFYGSQNASHAYSIAGTYYVTLTAMDSSGCTGDATEIITVNPPTPYAPPQFSSANHNTATRPEPQLSQREGNILVITQDGEATVTVIDVYTINGQLVTSQQPSSAVTEIPLAQSGCYIVKMTMSNGEILSDKIVLGL